MKALCIITNFFILLISMSLCAYAQITLDGTLGPAGPLSGPNYEIKADLGKQTGSNLFHSFARFNINTGESAAFTGPDTVSNIIARVTGRNPSLIDGQLRSEIPGANLFLLNPGGIMFGPNSSLNIGGSFYTSTAEYLRLGQEGTFDAAYPENSVLTAAPPSAFGFTENTPGDISTEGILIVPEGNTLSLTGGNITISHSGLGSQGGNIHIAAIASAGEMMISDSGPDISAFDRQGEISVSNGSLINVSGDKSGEIHIRGGKFLASDANTSVGALTVNGEGGDIDIRMSGELRIVNGATIYSKTFAGGTGNAGNIRIEADESEINNARIQSDTAGIGNAGDISISAHVLTIADKGTILSETNGMGRGGDVTLKTDILNLLRGGVVQTFAKSEGPGGNISAAAQNAVNISGFEMIDESKGIYSLSGFYSNTFGTGKSGSISVSTDILAISDNGLITSDTVGENIGNGGDISLNVNRLAMNQGYVSSSGRIGNNGTQLSGDAGNIFITAQDSVSISGSGIDDKGLYGEYYGLYSQTQGSGKGGLISIKADELNLVKDAMINSQTFGSGAGGTISLEVSRMEIHEGGTVAVDSFGAGNAGDISLLAGESVTISGLSAKRLTKKDNTSRIYTAAHSSGHGGNFTVSTPFLNIGIYGSLHADTLGDETIDGNTLPDGDAGNIQLNADRFELIDGGIVSASSESTGIGGNIEIESDRLEMFNQGLITANSTDTGNAGDISIRSEDIRMESSIVTTGAENAGGGRMQIDIGESLRLSGSEITTSVKYGAGNGGDIGISHPEFMILNQSNIIARAYEGKGGNIDIVSEHFIRSSESAVDASSELGIDGLVIIKSPDEDAAEGLTILPANYLDTTRWLKTPCSARSGEKMSRFVITGRDAIPSALDDWLPAPTLFFDSRKNSD